MDDTKKNVTKETLVSDYMEFVLENNHEPTSVFSFAKAYNFKEETFYKHFGSFYALKSAVFTMFFENTMDLISKSEEFKTFDTRSKLLSFYFTFFEVLIANRSYVLYALKGDLKKIKVLKKLKQAFRKFIDSLEIEKIDVKHNRIEKIQNKAIQESAWLQLLIITKFWLDDNSPDFEKTDVFIEKTVNATFDLMDITPLKSVVDLGKFILKEKFVFQ